ncbi:unnamed protein product [Chrysoparadoxa australica]
MKKYIAITLGALGCAQGFMYMSSGAGLSTSRRSFIEQSVASTAAIATIATASSAPVSAGDEVQTTSSGLQYIVTKEGSGAKPIPGATVKAHYTGWLKGFGEDGIKFDSSRDRGRPFTFKVGAGQVIKGWDEAFLDMQIGERRKLIIPSDLGYGQ